MLTPDKAVIQFVKSHFPDVLVTLGVGLTDLDKPQILTVASTGAFSIGDNARAGRWLTDFTVFDVDRDRAFTTAKQVLHRVREGVFDGSLEGPVSVKVVSLPQLVDNGTSSQRHSAVSFALQFVGHFG